MNVWHGDSFVDSSLVRIPL